MSQPDHISADDFRKHINQACARLYPLVWSIVRGFGFQDTDVNDLAQETFLKVLEKIDQLKEDATGWVAMIARCTAIDACRAKSRRRRHPSESLDAHGDSVAGPICEPSEGLVKQEEQDLLDRQLSLLGARLADLPPEPQTLLQLRYLEGLVFDEIAETLSIPRGSVGYRLCKAEESLRQAMAC